FEPAKLRVDCFVAAFLGPYSPRTSRITGPGFACVVFAFTMGMADRVNRREVENVETHFRNLGKNALTVFKRAAGSGKHFIPCAESRANRVDGHAKFFVQSGIGSVGITGD